MKTCPQCNQANRNDARFCAKCGTDLRNVREEPPESVPHVASPAPEPTASRSRLLPLAVGGLVVIGVLIALLWWQFSPSDQVTSALGTATVLLPTAVPGADLNSAVDEAREVLERNPKLATDLNELMAAYNNEGIDAALELAQERGYVDDQGMLRLVLVLDVDDTTDEGRQVIQALVGELEEKGAFVEGTFLDEVTLLVPVQEAVSQVEEEGVESLLDGFTQLEHVQHVRLPTLFQNQQGRDRVVGEGVAVSEADKWHDAGVRGQGVKVGVIDLGFFGYQDLLGNGLPETVEVDPKYFDRFFNEEVHGTGVSEIVHEMAPDAELYIGIAPHPQALFDVATWMADNGVRVINFSAGSSYGPFDGTSIMAEIVDRMAARGVLWVNAAGNEAQSHWRGTFQDEDGNGWLDFEPGRELMTVAGDDVTLSWWQGNQDVDYDLCFFNQSGTRRLACSAEIQAPGAGIDPVEGRQVQGGRHYLGVFLNGDDPDSSPLDIFVHGEIHPDFQVAEGSLSTPADARGALAVGAVIAENDRLAPYSSQGPTADGRKKPELSAPTHVKSVAYSDSPVGFNGTSAAAPHIAGAGALVLSAFPNMTRDELAQYLITHTKDLGPSGYDFGYGEGRLALGNAPDAGSIPPVPPTVTPPPVITTGGFQDDFSNPNSGLPPQASGDGWTSGYQNGIYLMNADFFPFGSSWELYEGLDAGDFTLTVDTQRLDGAETGAYGVVFRVRDNRNYYVFQIRDSGLASLQRVVNGSIQSLSGLKTANINDDSLNKLTVEARGRTISVAVNGEEFYSVDDDRLAHGTVGFIVTNSILPVTVGFDNLVIAP